MSMRQALSVAVVGAALISGCTARPQEASLDWEMLAVHQQLGPTCWGHAAAQSARLAWHSAGVETGDLDGEVAALRMGGASAKGRGAIETARLLASAGADSEGATAGLSWRSVDEDGYRDAILAGHPVLVAVRSGAVGHMVVGVGYDGDWARVMNSWGDPQSPIDCARFGFAPAEHGTDWVPMGSLCQQDGASECVEVWVP